jgi:predicted nucleotidyltransferase
VSPWTEAGRAVAAAFAHRAASRFADRIARIVLFGSVARGSDGPESDVDVLVVVRSRDREVREGLDEIAFDVLSSTHRAPVLVIYPEDAWEHARASGSELVAAVEREGVVLWTRNDAGSSSHA